MRERTKTAQLPLDDDPALASDFIDFRLRHELIRAVENAGYETPRPIQATTIPPARDGRDILGLAQTGTGKTVAFGLPILERLLAKPGRGPRVLVVAPTRELALQIDGELRKLAQFTRIKTATVFGGVSDRAQIRNLQRRPEIVVACPGRLLDLLRRGFARLDKIETLVLDEADQLFDMGFLPDVRRIISALPKKRQNLLFAATMPREIRELAEQILNNPAVAELAHSTPAATIDHSLYWIDQQRKRDLLCRIFREKSCASAIVFTRTKYRARRLARDLEKFKYRAVALQGDMSQAARDRAMERFRRGRYDILVATDIVARGIDVEQVSHVINFDVPSTPEAYTHRIGRTGRAERSGTAYTFATDEDVDMVRAIERTIGDRIVRSTVDGLTIPEPERGTRSPRTTRRRTTKPPTRGSGDATSRRPRSRSRGRPTSTNGSRSGGHPSATGSGARRGRSSAGRRRRNGQASTRSSNTK
ncbi:MAG: DEAD/DEAH box helicase [Planctomycetes bacterium]|nr:DEAD/DEAH box helicase [Planctomycetota bacterium]